jgi:2,3-bisphosphoglycerate-independent phosphoglycerate mutase
MRIILILLDGLGDRSYETLGHRTPLQAATTPNLDRVAAMGSNGLYHPSLPGLCHPSETAHFRLFGCDPAAFPGRGLLEAVGYGIPFHGSDVLSLAHLCGVSWSDGIPFLEHPRRRFTTEADDTAALYRAVARYDSGDIRFRLHQTGPNDAILVVTGEVSPHISDCDPMIAGKPLARVTPLAESPEPEESTRTAGALNRYLSRCHGILRSHPVNLRRAREGRPPADFLTTLRAGRRTPVESFESKWGCKALMIASGAVYAGLARELGFDFKTVNDGPDPGEDLRQRLHVALEDRNHDFIHVHTKAPDEAAHKGDAGLKSRVISMLDGALEDAVDIVENGAEVVLAVTADHSTPSCPPLIHSGEPVPLAIAGPRIRRDRVTAFNEIDAAGGCLGMLRGPELMRMLLNCADRSILDGHRLGPQAAAHFPTIYPPFRLET